MVTFVVWCALVGVCEGGDEEALTLQLARGAWWAVHVKDTPREEATAARSDQQPTSPEVKDGPGLAAEDPRAPEVDATGGRESATIAVARGRGHRRFCGAHGWGLPCCRLRRLIHPTVLIFVAGRGRSVWSGPYQICTSEGAERAGRARARPYPRGTWSSILSWKWKEMSHRTLQKEISLS